MNKTLWEEQPDYLTFRKRKGLAHIHFNKDLYFTSAERI